ncbi:histone-lysine N-methyltransferase PR-Set7 [Trichonephila inaurata madagascariensis]|uniref:Histone-lysine N-methyltransferase PR-Set7 n=1 Tax=Trichonephila inaurata madagascariensis TaxID=2747483 RepID=A0A8X7CG32_9ARAC|nr:histone-lysine N-methyltransferase PR-Set7 [Trichonephila inaurata madagascariensis]
MSKAGRRKAHRSKTLIEPSKMSEKGSKVIQTDITKYFVQNEDSITDNLRLPEGSLPSPDDAALPCSTSLCSDLTKSLKDQKCLDSDKDLDKNETIVPEEKIQEIFNMTNKDKSDVSKKKKNKKQPQQIRNSQMTDFFPVRRSNRKPLPKVMKSYLDPSMQA